MKPVDVINSIRKDPYNLSEDGHPKKGVEGLLDMLHGMARQLSEGLYERTDHFIYELIQNAEDNEYQKNIVPTLKFKLLEVDPTHTPGACGCLCVINNERGFREENVRALCNFDKSTKKGLKNQGFIGEKGIGFKSVFMVSDSPHIYSNGYRFKFLKNDPIATVGYSVPYWLDDTPDVVEQDSDATTAILLPLSAKNNNYEFIKQQLESFSPETALFLKKLRVLEVHTSDTEKIIECEVSKNEKTLTHIVNEKYDQKQFWVFSDKFDVPAKINEEKREGVTSTEISVAFPLDGITGEERLFAYLPTEQKPGFPFHINADFLLPASRESILRNNRWNGWLLESLSSVVIGAIKLYLDSDEGRYKAYQYIPLPDDVDSWSVYQAVCESICEGLKHTLSVLCDDLNLSVPDEAVRVSSALRLLLDGEKPSYFENTQLIHEEISKYERQLNYIGVNICSKTDVEKIFSDSNWVSRHDDEWLQQAYVYLIDLYKKKKTYQEFKLVRASTGKYYCPTEIFRPADEATRVELDKIPKAYQGEIKFVDSSLYKEIIDTDSSLVEALGIKKFSLYSFLSEIFIPSVANSIETLSADSYGVLFEVFLHLVTPLSDEKYSGVVSGFPILLASGEASKSQIDDLVVPEGWMKSDGWEQLFKNKEDREHFKWLHSCYLRWNRTAVKRFFSVIGVVDSPALRVLRLERYDACPEAVNEDYYYEIRNTFFDNCGRYDATQYKYIETPIFPMLGVGKGGVDKKTQSAVVRWLNRYPDLNEIAHAGGYWFYRTNRYGRFISDATYKLKNTRWVKSTLGLKKPGEVFLKDATLERIFGNKLPYLEDNLKDEVVEFLGINKSATEANIFNFLKEISGELKVKKSLLVAVYSYLNDYCESYKSYFTDNALIYVQKAEGGGWLKSSEVIWSDGHAVIGDAFGWLEKYYPETLKSFFINKLGVAESISDDCLIDAWLRIQEDESESEKVEGILEQAIPAALRTIVAGHEEQSEHFVQNARVWTQGKTWECGDDVFYADDQRLRRLFSDKLDFFWRPDNSVHARLRPIYDALGVKSLSLESRYTIDESSTVNPSSHSSYLTHHTVKLLAYALKNFDDAGGDDLNKAIEDNRLALLAGSHEVILDDLRIVCTIGYYSVTIADFSAYWDEKQGILYLDSNADQDDIIDDLEQQLSKYLWGARYREISDRLTKVIAVTSEKRFRKIRDNSSWHLSREELKLIDSMLEKGRTKSAGETEEDTSETSISITNSEDSAVSEGASNNTQQNKERASNSLGENEDAESKEGKPRSINNPNTGAAYPNGSQAPRTARKPSGRGFLFKGRGSRSKNIASNINQARRSQLRSYVVSELTESDVDTNDGRGAEQQEHRRKLGERAELIVLDDLRVKGYMAERMPANNPGYDIEAKNPVTGELLFFEVKGDSYGWSDKGVGITQRQYLEGSDKKGSYYLAVVDNLTSIPSAPFYIRDPVSYITEYRFDSGWADLATPIKSIDIVKTAESVLDELLELTADTQCSRVLYYCEENAYPYPDIGTELADEKGKVVLENIELLWEEEKLMVFIDQADVLAAKQYAEGWDIFASFEIELILKRLDRHFEKID